MGKLCVRKGEDCNKGMLDKAIKWLRARGRYNGLSRRLNRQLDPK